MYRTHSFPKIAPQTLIVSWTMCLSNLHPQTLIMSWKLCLSKIASPNTSFLLKRGNDINNSKGVFPKGAYTTQHAKSTISSHFVDKNFTTLLTNFVWFGCFSLIAKGYIQQISPPPIGCFLLCFVVYLIPKSQKKERK